MVDLIELRFVVIGSMITDTLFDFDRPDGDPEIARIFSTNSLLPSILSDM